MQLGIKRLLVTGDSLLIVRQVRHRVCPLICTHLKVCMLLGVC